MRALYTAVLLSVVVSSSVSSTVFAQNDEKNFADEVGKWIDEDNKRRGYTGMELTQMIATVSQEKSSALAAQVIADQIKIKHAELEKAGKITSQEESQQFLRAMVNRYGQCSLFHGAQRDSLLSRGSDASRYEKKRAKVASGFIYTARAIGLLVNDDTVEKQLLDDFNDNYEENIKSWRGLMKTAGVEGSAEQKKYRELEKACELAATDMENVWGKTRDMVDYSEVEAEATRRLTAGKQ